jgi:uncharacterized membrane protein YqaE (UPF0057 family)
MSTNKVIAIVAVLITGGYLLPTGIALWKGSGETTKIFLVNFLLGWTVVGWVVALFWALK